MKYKNSVDNKIHHEIKLSGQDIISLIRTPSQFKSICNLRRKGEFKDVEVSFGVPTGGDYSGVRLDINDDCPIRITFTTEEKDI